MVRAKRLAHRLGVGGLDDRLEGYFQLGEHGKPVSPREREVWGLVRLGGEGWKSKEQNGGIAGGDGDLNRFLDRLEMTFGRGNGIWGTLLKGHLPAGRQEGATQPNFLLTRRGETV